MWRIWSHTPPRRGLAGSRIRRRAAVPARTRRAPVSAAARHRPSGSRGPPPHAPPATVGRRPPPPVRVPRPPASRAARRRQHDDRNHPPTGLGLVLAEGRHALDLRPEEPFALVALGLGGRHLDR